MLKLTYVNHFKFSTHVLITINITPCILFAQSQDLFFLTIKILVVIATFELQKSYCAIDAQHSCLVRR